MARTETIAHINARLAKLDECVQAVADMVEDIATKDAEQRPLTARELELIEQSREDFRSGRTLGHEEVQAMSDKFIASLADKASLDDLDANSAEWQPHRHLAAPVNCA